MDSGEEEGTRELTVDKAIERIGVGSFQHRLLAVCGITWAADAAEVLLIGFALPDVTDEFALSSAQAGLIATSTFLGMLAGAWFWGAISDRIGRRTGFQLTVLVFAVFGFLSAFAPDPVTLGILRALTGFGLGGALPLDFSLFAEYLPRRNRGRYLVMLEAFWALGTIVAAGLAWLIVPAFGWRPLLATSAVAAFLVFWIRRRVPESPRYLAASGRHEEAAAILARVAERNGRSMPAERLVARAAGERGSVRALWRPSLRRSTLMLWSAWFAISLGYYGVFLWLPSILVDRGFSFFATYGSVFLLGLAQIPGYLSAAYLVERWGRRSTLAAYLFGSAVFTYLFALATGFEAILAAALVMSFFALGAWGALYAYTPELYPTVVRTTGMGAASGMTRIAGSIAPLLGGYLLAISLVAGLSAYAAAFLLGAVVVATLGVETRGRALSEDLESTPRPRGHTPTRAAA